MGATDLRCWDCYAFQDAYGVSCLMHTPAHARDARWNTMKSLIAEREKIFRRQDESASPVPVTREPVRDAAQRAPAESLVEPAEE